MNAKVLSGIAELLGPHRDALVEAWARGIGQLSPSPPDELQAYCAGTLDGLLGGLRTNKLEEFLAAERQSLHGAARAGASLVPLALATRVLDRTVFPLLLEGLPDREALAEALQALEELGDRRLEGLLMAEEEESNRRLAEAQDQSAKLSERAQELARTNQALRKLSGEASHRAAQIELLTSVIHKISPILEPDRLLQEAAQAIQTKMNYMYVAVVVLDSEGVLVGRWAGKPGVGRRSAGRAQGPARGIIGRALRKRAPQVAPDVSKDPDHHPDVEGAASEMVIPLLEAGEVLGAIDYQSEHVGAFDLDDVAAGEILADFLVVSLRNARLYSETQA